MRRDGVTGIDYKLGFRNGNQAKSPGSMVPPFDGPASSYSFRHTLYRPQQF